jgi:hypothetical protein
MPTDGAHYEYQPSFILGFHGCDEAVGERILSGQESHLKPSEKIYDWLGSGIYFWEGSVARASEWAAVRHAEGKIRKPFVLGAIIDLRHCLDLFDRGAMLEVQATHQFARKISKAAGVPLPKNVGITPDKAGRLLDCHVMNTLHTLRELKGRPEFDSVRGPFLEGKPIYRGAGFRSHSHIQICVRETACIKGYFRPLSELVSASR